MRKSVAGQVVISLGLVFTVAAMVVGNLPDSQLKADLSVVMQPFLDATGLNQAWQVYAAPRDFSAYVDARVDYSDGTSSVYAIPNRRGLGAYADYRWQKYMECIRADDGKQLWPAYADYVASRARADGRDPVRVTLIRRWAQTLPPGRGPERGPWQEVVMGVFPVGAAR